MFQAFGKCEHASSTVGMLKPHPVNGLDRRQRLRRRKLRHRPSNSEHRAEIGRDLDLEHRIDSRRARIGDRDSFVHSRLDEPHTGHVHADGFELEGRRAVIGLEMHRPRLDAIDQQSQRGKDSRVAVPQAVSAKLAGPHRSIPRGHAEKTVAFEHHALGDQLPGRNHRPGSVP